MICVRRFVSGDQFLLSPYNDAIRPEMKKVMSQRAPTLHFDGFRVLTFALSADYWYRGRAAPVLG